MNYQLNPCLSPESSELLMLIDENNLSSHDVGSGDLYDQLIMEPILHKQQSIKYDYEPNLSDLLPPSEQPKSGIEQTESVNSEKVIKCSCSKTKCQKNYCDCFRANRPCSSQCSCTDCCNQVDSRIQNLPKRILGTGCRCQKSRCMKKYCECHSAGKKCTSQCQCIGCQNVQSNFEIEKPPRKKCKKDMEILEDIVQHYV